MEYERSIPVEKAWRDIRLSFWRKKLIWDMAANDLDLNVVEYRHGVPKALIEYKMELSQYKVKSLAGLIGLAKLAGLPLFVVRYGMDFDWWQIIPHNSIAYDLLETLKQTTDRITERAYVAFLYRLRGLEAPPDALEDLSDTMPAPKPIISDERAARIKAETAKYFKDEFGIGGDE